jgi:hypothetical protein
MLFSFFYGVSENLHQTLKSKRQAGTCHFSKDFQDNPGNLLTDRKKEMKNQKKIVQALQVLKRFSVNLKALGVERFEP